MLKIRKIIEPNKLFQVSLISFIIVIGVSWVLNKIIPDFPLLKGGFVLILFGIIILLTTLYTFGTNLVSLKIKDVIFMILVLVILVVLYILLPQIVPEIFSVIPGNEIGYEFRDFFTKTIGSAMRLGGTGVA